MKRILNTSSLGLVLSLFLLTACEQDTSSAQTNDKTTTTEAGGDTSEAADLVTRFQYAYFEQRFDDFHELLTRKDQAAKSVQDFNREFESLTRPEELMTTFMLSTSDYEVDSTVVIAPDSMIVFGRAMGPLIDKVQREVSIILRDVGDEEEMGMLLSLLQERMKLRGGLKETVPTQHLVIKDEEDWRIRVGFDG